MRRAVVESIGHYLPERVVENSEFEATLDTNDAWIRSRTGIERRHFAAEGETTSDMGIKAAQAALANAGCSVEDVDAIILATSTADLTFPSAATMVQHGLGMNHGFAFACPDVQPMPREECSARLQSSRYQPVRLRPSKGLALSVDDSQQLQAVFQYARQPYPNAA